MRTKSAWAVVAAGVALLLSSGGGYMALVVEPKAFVPDRTEVVPLPQGMSFEEAPLGPDSCVPGSCSRFFRIRSVTGESGQQLLQQVRHHLEAQHGWHLDSAGLACRYLLPPLDWRKVCVSVSLDQDEPTTVQVILSASRADFSS